MSVPHSARPHLMKVWAVWHRGHTWGRAMPSHNPYAPMRLATGHRAGDAARPETRQERRGYRAVDATADFNHSAARPALQPPFGHCVPACPCSPAALLVRCATPRVRATPGRSTAITGRGRRSRIRSATWPPLRAEPSGPTAPPTRHGERTRLPPRGRARTCRDQAAEHTHGQPRQAHARPAGSRTPVPFARGSQPGVPLRPGSRVLAFDRMCARPLPPSAAAADGAPPGPARAKARTAPHGCRRRAAAVATLALAAADAPRPARLLCSSSSSRTDLGLTRVRPSSHTPRTPRQQRGAVAPRPTPLQARRLDPVSHPVRRASSRRPSSFASDGSRP